MNQENQQGSIGRSFIEIVVLAAVYVATARLGQMLAIPPGNVTPIWIPSGIILAAVLLRGPVIWPGIWLGAFVGNVWAYIDWENFSNLGVSFISGTANGAGDTLAALIAAHLIERFAGTRSPFASAFQVIQFVVFGALVCGAISAVFGVTGLAIVGLLPWSDYTYVWLTWWVGDAVGVILLCPLLLTLPAWVEGRWLPSLRWPEFLGFIVTLMIVTSFSLELIAGASLSFPLFMVLPVLLWGALRFPSQITILASVLVAATAIFITSLGKGPLQSEDLNQSLIELQLFLFTVLITVLLVLGIMNERRVLDERVRKMTRSYLRMFDRTLDGVITTDGQGRMESFNREAERIFGYTKEELVGRNVNFLVPKQFREQHYRFIDNPEDHGTEAIFGEAREVTGCHKDGHDIPLMISVNPSLEEDNGHFLLVMQDLSEAKTLQENCARYQQTFDFLVQSSFDALLVINNNLVVNVNRRFEELFGYSAEELLGQPLKVKLFTTDLVFIEGHDQGLESEGINNHGRRFPAAVRQRSAKLGDTVVKIISIHDLTELKSKQAALGSALDRVQNASLAKSRFLSAMSHELRTPMNTIVGFAQLLDMGEGDLSERQRESLKEIRSAGNHFLEVIDDVLDLAKIESGTFVVNCEDVDLNAQVKDCVDTLKEHAAKRGIKMFNHLSDQMIYRVSADRFRFKQVLLNLLSNAVKFNHADGTVSISVDVTAEQRVRLSITDSGVGLSEAEQELVFKPFERPSAIGTTLKGTGIGLVIAKSLVELMGGTIGFESYKYMGSTFWVELPLIRGESVSGKPSVSAESLAVGSQRLRISDKAVLCIDADPANVKLLQHLLDKLGLARFYSVSNVAQGLDLVREQRFDVVVVDFDATDKSAYEFLQQLRADRGLASIPLIALSATNTDGDIHQAMAAGFDEFLAKPLDLDRLSKLLIRLLS